MARLSDKEKRVLEELQKKAEAPDTSPSNRTLNVSMDLGDPKQVDMAKKMGLLDNLDDDEDDDGDGDGDGDADGSDGDEPPRRRGYFKDD